MKFKYYLLVIVVYMIVAICVSAHFGKGLWHLIIFGAFIGFWNYCLYYIVPGITDYEPVEKNED